MVRRLTRDERGRGRFRPLDRLDVRGRTGAAAGVTTDQRGVTRPQLVGCDIGAVEVTQADYMVEAAVVTPKFTG
jgi:hypothetical protein